MSITIERFSETQSAMALRIAKLKTKEAKTHELL